MDVLLSKKEKTEMLLNRDGDKCAVCNKKISKSEMTIDHWIPRARGGSDDLSNLRLAHKRCNSWKGDRVPNEDGTIPPRPQRINYQDRKRQRQEILDSLCTDCYDGRLLLEGENCPHCGVPAGPEDWPHWAKRRANECHHSPPEWCWACSIGIVERKPVFMVLLEGN